MGNNCTVWANQLATDESPLAQTKALNSVNQFLWVCFFAQDAEVLNAFLPAPAV